MLRNFAKMNRLLEEVGWQLHPPGDTKSWDGLLGWFLAYTAANPNILVGASMRSWHRAARTVEPIPVGT
jgi:hypothetical protein